MPEVMVNSRNPQIGTTSRVVRTGSLLIGAGIGAAFAAVSGAGWIAAVIAVITVGAIVELWRRRNGATVRRSMGVLIVVVVLALAGLLGIAGWIPAAFGWGAALAFIVAWADNLITLAVAPRGGRPSASL